MSAIGAQAAIVPMGTKCQILITVRRQIIWDI